MEIVLLLNSIIFIIVLKKYRKLKRVYYLFIPILIHFYLLVKSQTTFQFGSRLSYFNKYQELFPAVHYIFFIYKNK